MFEVKVTVELPGVPEAINNLADSISKIAGFPVASVTPAITNSGNGVAAGTVEGGLVINRGKTEQKKETPVAAPAPVEQPEQAPPLVNVPDTPAAPVEQPVTAPVAPAPVPAKKYTFKQISTAGAKLCADLGKMDALVSLLNSKYGVPAITMIDESRYGELADDLISLGAVI